MIMETMIHAETQSEDEITESMIKRSQTMYADVACPWMYTPNHQLKNNKM